LPERKKPRGAGVWEILDVRTGQRLNKFRARRQADVDRNMQIVLIGLGKKPEDVKLVFVADWED
jgi:hypothetical protein